MALERVVVVGASLAGLRAAEILRADGFAGSLTIVGDEPHRPYDRPPLSKQVLTGEWGTDRVWLPAGSGDALDVTWELGVGARSLDLGGRSVALADGRALPFDGLVVATGAAPRTLTGTDELAGVHVVRTLDDATRLAADLDAAPRRVVVIGAGFIGAEVAASVRQRGIEVTLVEPLPQPLARVLGPEVGAVVAAVHRDHGVDVRLGVGVEAIEGDERVERVRLADATVLEADVVVVGIGVTPNTGWLEGSGLQLDDGVVCDETTLAAPGVVAAGDVARWPNGRYGGEVMRVEHWEHALDMGAAAARRLLSEAAGEPGEPFTPVPWFWSDQYDRKIQLAGRTRPGDEMAVVAGSLEERKFCALFGRDGQVVAALGMSMPGRVVKYRRLLTEPDGLAWDQALADAGRMSDPVDPAQAAAAELVEVVDEDGAVERVVTRAELRAGRLRHRCTYVLVLDHDDRPVVHQRAPWKDVWPDRWDVAFGGIVAVGEDWNDAARRELAEEAGVDAVLRHAGGGAYDDDDVSVLGRVYLARHDGPYTVPDGEVVAVESVPLADLDRLLVERAWCPDSVALAGPALRALTGQA